MEEKNEGTSGKACSSEARGNSGWSGGAGFPETSSYPTAPPSSITSPLKLTSIWLLMVFLVADPNQSPEGVSHPNSSLPGPESGPLRLVFWTQHLLYSVVPYAGTPSGRPQRPGLETLDALSGHFMFTLFLETPPMREPQPSFKGSLHGKGQILRSGNREQQASGWENSSYENAPEEEASWGGSWLSEAPGTAYRKSRRGRCSDQRPALPFPVIPIWWVF